MGGVPARAVLLGQRTAEPSGPVRAARRASVSNISATSPPTSPHRAAAMQQPGQPDRLGGQLDAVQPGAGGAVCPSVKIR